MRPSKLHNSFDLNLDYIMACINFPYEGATSLLWNNKRLCAGGLHTLS